VQGDYVVEEAFCLKNSQALKHCFEKSFLLQVIPNNKKRQLAAFLKSINLSHNRD